MTTATSAIPRLDLAVDAGSNFVAAERQARATAQQAAGGSVSLMAWWDSDRATGGPSRACACDSYAGVAGYAEQHGASCRVHVNRGQYEFFYGGSAEEGAEALEQDGARQTRRSPGSGDRAPVTSMGRHVE